MKIGFVGFGKSVHRYHAPFISMIDDVEVCGYYSPGSNDFSMMYPGFEHIERFDSLEQLLYSEIEVVIVATPAKVHYQIAKQCLLAGKHVLVEKPMTDTLAQAKELYSIAEEKNLKFCPHQNRRFDSDFLEIKYILANKNIGKIIEIESSHTQYRLDKLERTGRKYDGSVYGHAVHLVDQVVSLFGEPDSLIYDFGNQKDFAVGTESCVDDYFNIIAIYNNVRIRIRYSQVVVNEPPRWIINATNATVEKYGIDQQERDLKQGWMPDNPDFGQDRDQNKCTIYYLDGSTEILNLEEKLYYNQFFLAFKNCIETNSEPPVTKTEALTVINILETIVNNEQYQPLKQK